MVNKVILIGNVGMDPEVRTTENGVKVARVRLATTERLFDRQANETREHTEWHTVTLWRGLADVVDRYVHKGSQIYIEGRLRTRDWMDKDNNKRYTTEILADSMNLLDAAAMLRLPTTHPMARPQPRHRGPRTDSSPLLLPWLRTPLRPVMRLRLRQQHRPSRHPLRHRLCRPTIPTTSRSKALANRSKTSLALIIGKGFLFSERKVVPDPIPSNKKQSCRCWTQRTETPYERVSHPSELTLSAPKSSEPAWRLPVAKDDESHQCPPVPTASKIPVSRAR